MDEKRTRGPRAYWIDGVNGILLEAALTDLAHGEEEMTLTITKQRLPNGKFSFKIEVKKK